MCQFDHRNVMSLIGVCIAPSEPGSKSVGPSIVMPFMERGSLLDYLRKESNNLYTAERDEVSDLVSIHTYHLATYILLICTGSESEKATCSNLLPDSKRNGVLSQFEICAQRPRSKELPVSTFLQV